MTTSNASFDSSEEKWAKYIAYGGTTGYTGGLEGMVTSPVATAQNAYIRLAKTNPIAVAYPNAWVANAFGSARAAEEPTAAEWANYGFGATVLRVSVAVGELEAVDLGSGQWVVRTKASKTVTFPAPSVGSTGCQVAYAVLCLPGYDPVSGVTPLYAVGVLQFDTPLDAAVGGSNLTIPGNQLVFELR